MLYLDSSALTKLLATEVESVALDSWLTAADQPCATSQLAIPEVARALARAGHSVNVATLAPLGGRAIRAGARDIAALPLTPEVLVAAATIPPPAMRTLDALHLATALALGPSLRALVTYDARQADAALALGLRVAAPA